MPEYIRPLFCKGSGPFRWAALSGDPADIAATDAALLEQLRAASVLIAPAGFLALLPTGFTTGLTLDVGWRF